MYEGYASKKKNECEIACMSAHVLSGEGGKFVNFAKGTVSPNF